MVIRWCGVALLLFCALSVPLHVGVAERLSLKRIFDKPYIAGSRPSIASLSPDGRHLLYHWDADANGRNRLWTIATAGGTTKQVLDSAVSSCVWSPDGKLVAYTQEGDLFMADPTFETITRLTRTPAAESQITWSPASDAIAVATNNILVFPTTHPGVYQLTHNTSSDVSYSILEFSPDGKRVLFAEYNQEGLPEFVVPRYSEKHVTASKTRRGFSKVRLGIAPVDTGSILWLKTDVERFVLGDASFSPDGKRILFDRFSIDRKHRALFVFEGDSMRARLVYTEYDSAWIEGGILAARWAANGEFLLFTSESDGWNHLYALAKDSTDLRQVTGGKWEIQWFAIHPDGHSIYITANKDDHAQWQLYRLNVSSGELEQITERAGTYESPVMSKNGKTVVCSYSDLGMPAELHVIDGKTDRRITYSIPKEFLSVEWVIPEIIRFTARNDETIPALLYKPKALVPGRQYPCVVFVHGAGYLQNVYRGWSYYYREYMFHTYLVNKGYVVFEIDYRGSAGHGRKFRTDVYMHLGGLDLQDELDGVEYLKRLGYIDSTRIGMYGGSYGGFLSLMALLKSPDTYACAAVLRAVTDWGNYYHHNPWYTAARLGTPEQNPEAYKKSSPITFADSLTKPLLILHGMADDNVFFQDAVELVKKLQKSGKTFEMMMYPTEAHSFTEPESWYDEYRRIDEFFDRHLLSANR